MKTIGRFALALTTAAVAWVMGTGAAAAQDWAPPPAPTDVDHLQESLFPPELIMRHYREIGLTDEQRTVVTQAIQGLQNDLVELQWRLFDLSEELSGLLEGTPVDEAATMMTMEEVLTAERDIKLAHLRTLIRIKNALTVEQQQQLNELRRHAGYFNVFRDSLVHTDSIARSRNRWPPDTVGWAPAGTWLPGEHLPDAAWLPHTGGGGR